MAYSKSALLVLPILLCSCARQEDTKAPPLNKYAIHGEIVRLNPQEKTATIHHKDIEGYMKSMTMTFPVKDPQEFAGLQEGICIEGNLYEQGDDLWVGDIKHLDLKPDECVPPQPAAEQKPK